MKENISEKAKQKQSYLELLILLKVLFVSFIMIKFMQLKIYMAVVKQPFRDEIDSLDQKISESKVTLKKHEKTVSSRVRILISNVPYMLKQH